MSVRQRLRTKLGSRGHESICWSCAFGLRRYVSAVQQPELGTTSYNGVFDEDIILEDASQQFYRSQKKERSIGRASTTKDPSFEEPFATQAQIFRDPQRRNPRASDLHFSTRSLRLNGEHRRSCTQVERRRYATAASPSSHVDTNVDPSSIGADPKLASTLQEGDIREHLRLWQQQRLIKEHSSSVVPPPQNRQLNASQNLATQSGEDDSFSKVTQEDEAEESEDDGFVEIGSDEPAPDFLKNELFLRRGDLVELFVGKEPILAIFVRNVARQCQFYTMRGQWLHRETKCAKFSIPHFVEPDDLEDILPYLPTSEIAEAMIDQLQTLDVNAPREAGAKLLERMSKFYQASDSIFRSNADRLNRTYEIIAPSKTGSGKTVMTLEQIATIVLQKNSAELRPAMLWAVHRAIVQSQNIIIDTFNYRQNIRYEVQPRQYLVEIDQVRGWMRDFQESVIEQTTESNDLDASDKSTLDSKNPIAKFVQKARAAIQESRQTRALAPNGCLGPSSVKVSPSEAPNRSYRAIDVQELSRKEKTIIHYIDAWVMSRYLNPYTNLQALGPMILRAVDMYDGLELNEVIGFTFLQELGIIPQWANRTLYQTTDLRLPDQGYASTETDQLRTEAYREFDGSALLKDSMRELRKDWGDLPVFCIDSADTVERDDGVSLEPVDGTGDECWVHVHVANPSAFIAPDSAAAKYAAQISETVYLPERKYTMISPSLTESRLSLAKGRPCLTFSAKLSMEGHVLERKIVPGRVHNVHYITRQVLGREMGISEAAQSDAESLLTLGGDYPTVSPEQAPESVQALSDAYISQLRRLLELGQAAARQRGTNSIGPVLQSIEKVTSLHPHVFVDPNQVKDNMITRYEGDPIIRIEQSTSAVDPVTQMVRDLMILAGEVAASWCAERNIPIPYRGMVRNPEPETDPETFRKELIDPQIAKDGYAYLPDLARYMTFIGQAAVSSSPLEHIVLGLPAYCKATSPLRRYTDMYTHWQIEAALRHEAATGKSLIGSSADQSYLPFSRAAVEEYASTVLHREKRLSKVSKASERHWITQALFRAFYFKEAPLPDTFEVTTQARFNRRQTCWLHGWSTRGYIEENEASLREGGIMEGDRWEAKISDINTYWKNILLEPIRLLRRGESRGLVSS